MANDPLATMGPLTSEARDAISEAQQNGGNVQIREAQNAAGSYRREIIVSDNQGNVRYTERYSYDPVHQADTIDTSREISINHGDPELGPPGGQPNYGPEISSPPPQGRPPKRYLVDQQYDHWGEMLSYDAEHVTSADELLNPVELARVGLPSAGELRQIAKGTGEGLYESAADTVGEVKGTYTTVKKLLTDAEYRQNLELLAQRILNDPALLTDAIENGLIDWNDELRTGWEHAKATGTQTEFLAKVKTKMAVSVAKMFIPGGAGVKILNKVASKCPALAKVIKKLAKVFGKEAALENAAEKAAKNVGEGVAKGTAEGLATETAEETVEGVAKEVGEGLGARGRGTGPPIGSDEIPSGSAALGPRRETGARALKDTDFEGAERVYEDIRKSETDVSSISKNTGISESRIARIKQHVFEKTHSLDDGIRRFDADPEIANAWRRLENGTHQPADIQLLDHELFESRFEGIFKTDYRTSHGAANRSGRPSGLE
jgi:hypothetical protein